MPVSHSILTRNDGATIAYIKKEGVAPGIVFLGGFMSDMDGTKAVALENYCEERKRSYVRFDYFGHGKSSGKFLEGTIRRWTEDTISVIDQLTKGPQILVGSSMGGWIMLLAALARPTRVLALIGIAAAPDFTETLLWNQFSNEDKKLLLKNKILEVPSDFDDQSYPISMDLIEDGRNHLLLNQSIPIQCPVQLLHGMRDDSVPWKNSLELSNRLMSEKIILTLIKDGVHRLSRTQDLKILFSCLDNLISLQT